MQVTELKSEGLSREYKVVLAASEIEDKVNAKLKEVSQTAALPGFRPGKVPAALLKKRYGSSIMGEVLEKAVGDSSRQAMEEKGLRPAMQPKVEITSFDEGKDLEYTIAMDVLPEIKPMDFKTLKLTRYNPEVDEKEIATTLDRIAGANKTSEPVKKTRKSKSGDVVVIDFVGKVDDVEFDGGAGEGHELELGSNSFIPGFEEQLIGSNAGDKVSVKVTFPEEYNAADLAGKDAVFDVEVKEIRDAKPAKIDDELAKKLGMEDLGKLKEAITEEQSREFRDTARVYLKRTLLDALADGHDFDVPAGMVDSEFEGIWGQYEAQRKAAEEAGEEVPDEDEDAQKIEFRDISVRRVRLGLLLSHIGQENNIQVAQEDINKSMMEEMRKYPGQEKMVMEYFQNNPEAQEQLTAPIYEDKVVDFIVEMAKVDEKKIGMEGLMKLLEEESEAAEKAKPKSKAKAKKPAAKKPAAKKPAAKKAPAKKAAAKKED